MVGETLLLCRIHVCFLIGQSLHMTREYKHQTLHTKTFLTVCMVTSNWILFLVYLLLCLYMELNHAPDHALPLSVWHQWCSLFVWCIVILYIEGGRGVKNTCTGIRMIMSRSCDSIKVRNSWSHSPWTSTQDQCSAPPPWFTSPRFLVATACESNYWATACHWLWIH